MVKLTPDYHIKDGEGQEKVVKDAMNFLAREGPDGDAVAEDADVAGDEDEEALEDPLEGVLGRSDAVFRVQPPSTWRFGHINLFRHWKSIKCLKSKEKSFLHYNYLKIRNFAPGNQ